MVAAILSEALAAVVPVEYIGQVPGTGLAGIAHPQAVDQLVAEYNLRCFFVQRASKSFCGHLTGDYLIGTDSTHSTEITSERDSLR